MSLRVAFLALLTSCALVAAGCKTLGSLGSGDEGGEVDYANDADSNMKLGDEAMESENFGEAARYYEYVKTKYPFLEAAKTAELKLGDCDFLRDRFIEARDRYQNFVRLHPTHPKVDYAAFRAALTHYKDIPSDLFILPPANEKDQQEVRAAMNAMTDFLRMYPDSHYAPEAKKVLGEVKTRLAEHEIYVADFYRRRDRWPAVIGRLSTVAKNYAGTGYDEKVFFGLHEAYLKMKDEKRAKEALRAYLVLHPDDRDARRARELLGPDVQPPAPAPSPSEAPDAGS
ncbi:MAG: outer membrane protein assembly factor BamD [Myxococcota bacterium]